MALAAGCSSVKPTSRANDVSAASSGKVSNTPARNVTDFTDGLRCMDETFLRYGTRDVSVILEDLADTTKKVSAGTRDMMISAISDMTRRSRAVKVITFGQDANNVVAFLNNAKQRSPFAVVPQFSIRGSITQLDEGVLRRQSDIGLALEPLLSAGSSRSRQFNVLGLDVSVAQTSDLALLPGVSSKNLVAIAKEGDAIDGQATIRKLGVNFSTSFQRTDGTAQALRNMVELSAIELLGRLQRLPYWTCLAIGPDNADIQRETEDWFIGMDRSGELVPYFQEQLRNRGFFDGPVDGRVTPALRRAISAYRRASGFAELDHVDLAFFRDFLHRPFPPPPPQPFVAELPSAPAAAAAPAPAPAGGGDPVAAASVSAPTAPAVTDVGAHGSAAAGVGARASAAAASVPVATGSTGGAAVSASAEGQRRLFVAPGRERFNVGEPVSFEVLANRNGYLYCYHQDAVGTLRRIFPNRHTRDPRISAGRPLRLPGAAPVLLSARAGAQETVACFSTPTEVYNTLPAALRWADFDALSLASFDEIAAILGPIARGDLARAQFVITTGR